jgi:PAS domain S-box-containing protein
LDLLVLALQRTDDKGADFQAILKDDHGSKETRLALKESEEKFRGLFEKASDALVYLNLSGRILDVNGKAEELAGLKREEIIGKSFLNIGLISTENASMLLSRLKNKLLPRSTTGFELFITRKNGEKRIIEVNSTLIRRNKMPVGVLAIVRDITARKKAEEALRESQQKFERLFRENPEAAVCLSPDFHVLDINPRFTELFTYSLEEIKGKDIDDVIVPDEKMEEAKMLNGKAERGYVYFDTVRRRKDGSLVPVSISAAPLVVEDRLIGNVALYKDISELKSAEAAVKETMEKLAAMNEKLQVVGKLIRHDVRNKLSVVTGNVFLVKKRLADHPEVFEYLDDVDAACRQIVKIFDFARNYEMLGDEELKYVDVAETFEKAVSQFSDFGGARVLNECHGLEVLSDSLLARLFYNLIENSLKYGERVSQIRVHYEKAVPEQLRLIYEDDGVGISAAERPNLFKEGHGRGTGYGLYLIKKMIQVYGWTIQETGQPGKGAEFAITIPKTSRDGKEGYRIK